jgi:hypothetical protein
MLSCAYAPKPFSHARTHASAITSQQTMSHPDEASRNREKRRRENLAAYDEKDPVKKAMLEERLQFKSTLEILDVKVHPFQWESNGNLWVAKDQTNVTRLKITR